MDQIRGMILSTSHVEREDLFKIKDKIKTVVTNFLFLACFMWYAFCIFEQACMFSF